MKAAVIVFPGSNRERDMLVALERSTGQPPLKIWHGDTDFPEVDLIVIPGGFSYGDYLRAGAMAAHSPVVAEIKARSEAGVYVLGVCNGFQVMCETGLLPGALLPNAGLKFICKNVHMRVERTDTPFTGGYADGQVISVPVAHHDGNYFADAETVKMLAGEGRVGFRYCDAAGATTAAANPNGSIANIAGIYNERGNVLGLMPHPEDAVDPMAGGIDGRAMFAGLVEALA